MRTDTLAGDRIRTFFDFVNPAELAGQRSQTIVPTQLLFLLSNDLIRQRAEVLAEQVVSGEADDDARIAALWLRVFNRPVSSAERGFALEFLAEMRRLHAGNEQPKKTELQPWTEFCHSLLASNEFVFRL
jgi:hypothetical protein